jgi:hypothetical protein
MTRTIMLALLIAGSTVQAHADSIGANSALEGREHHDDGDFDRAAAVAIASPATAAPTTAVVSLDAVRPSRASFRRGGAVLAVAGGVLVGAGLVFAVRSARAETEIERRHAEGASWRDVQSMEASGRTSSTLAAVFTVAGGAAAITGAVLYLVGRRAHGERRRTMMTVGQGSSGGGHVGVKWTF